MKGLIEHLESYLGKIDIGWKDADGTKWPFHVLRFKGGPIVNTITYSTLGLADIPLPSPASEKLIRHELIFMIRNGTEEKFVPGILHQVGMEVVSKGRPLLRGNFIGPRGKMFADTQMEALFVSRPCYLPEPFASHTSEEGVSCVFAWLVPITSKESEFVWNEGWPKFEQLLFQINPDLLDMRRTSIV